MPIYLPVLLVVVLFMPEYNGCKRWLVLPGLGTLQPSEIAKFAVVLVFAHIISLNHSRMESFAVGVVPFALVLGAAADTVIEVTAGIADVWKGAERRSADYECVE